MARDISAHCAIGTRNCETTASPLRTDFQVGVIIETWLHVTSLHVTNGWMCLYSPTAVGKGPLELKCSAILLNRRSKLSVVLFECSWIACVPVLYTSSSVTSVPVLFVPGGEETLCPLFVGMRLFRTKKGNRRKKFTITVKLVQYGTWRPICSKQAGARYLSWWYRGLQNGCRECYLTRDSTLNPLLVDKL